MEYRKWYDQELKTSLLGLGAMRLPKKDNTTLEIDEKEAIKMIRTAIDSGINFIDTAYIYNDGESEKIVGKALQDGYRSKVVLSTKIPLWLVNSEEDLELLFSEQLDRLKTNYVDLFLFHALDRNSLEKMITLNCFQFLDKKLKEGHIGSVGFSFHDECSYFKELINAYKWDACMLQFNFIDQESQAGIEGIEYATQKKVSIIVMEPLKGGLLCTPPDEVKNIINEHTPQLNMIEWSFKWISNFVGVKTILSGMSNIKMLEDNISYFEHSESIPLTISDKEMLDKVRSLYLSRGTIECTNCQYCLPCPSGVQIPINFMIYNENKVYNALGVSQNKYREWLDEDTSALKCTGCKLCEERCPQKISISNILRDIKKEFLEE